jgi:hypothetical protein
VVLTLPSIITLVPLILCIGCQLSLAVFLPSKEVRVKESALLLALQAIILLSEKA